MTENFRDITLAEVAVLFVALGATLAVLRKVVPALRKATRLIDDVVGVEETAPGRGDGQPGVMDRIAHLESRLAQIADSTAATVVQVHPNVGSSMRDQIDALTRSQAQMMSLIEERLPRRNDDSLDNP